MLDEHPIYMRHPARNEQSEFESTVYLGRYMPFSGVWYYVILDGQDIAGGRTRIGAVGWRSSRAPAKEEEQAPARLPVAV